MPLQRAMMDGLRRADSDSQQDVTYLGPLGPKIVKVNKQTVNPVEVRRRRLFTDQGEQQDATDPEAPAASPQRRHGDASTSGRAQPTNDALQYEDSDTLERSSGGDRLAAARERMGRQSFAKVRDKLFLTPEESQQVAARLKGLTSRPVFNGKPFKLFR